MSYSQYVEEGKLLVKQNKFCLPKEKGWRNSKVSVKENKHHPENYGWCLGSEDLIIDIDKRNKGDIAIQSLFEAIGVRLPYTVRTPGGVHIYLKIPEIWQNKKFNQELDEYPGIEFLRKGKCLPIAGNIRAERKNEDGTIKRKAGRYVWHPQSVFGFEQEIAPHKLLHLILKKEDSIVIVNDNSKKKQSSTDVRALIDKIPHPVSYNVWLNVGMALHNWRKLKGLEIFDDWSKLDTEKYEEGKCQEKWKTFDVTNTGNITLGTIYRMVESLKFEKEDKRVKKLVGRINTADAKEIKIDIYRSIAKSRFSDVNNNYLCKTVQKRYGELLGIKPEIKLIKSELRDKINSVNRNSDDSTLLEIQKNPPEFVYDWLYDNSGGKQPYLKKSNITHHSSESFNMENTNLIPGEKNIRASDLCIKYGLIKKIDAVAFLPDLPAEVKEITLDGMHYYNSFNHKLLTVPAKEYTNKGLIAIRRLKNHVNMICGNNEEYSGILLDWIAHQVQRPGDKLNWAPLIQGIQGCGKTYFSVLLENILCDRYVTVVNADQLKLPNNPWAVNSCVCSIEELKVIGEKRKEVTEKIKTLLTNENIQIHIKFKSQYKAPNKTNYIAFTNYEDAIILDDSDRRWFVIFCPLETISQLEDYVGETNSTYFEKLFSEVKAHSTEILKFFKDRKIPEKKRSVAPNTIYRDAMISTENSNSQGYDEIGDMIKEGGEYFNSEAISSHHLFEAYNMENFENTITANNPMKRILLKKLSFSKMYNRVRINGQKTTLWVHKSVMGKYPMLFKKNLNESERKEYKTQLKELRQEVSKSKL